MQRQPVGLSLPLESAAFTTPVPLVWLARVVGLSLLVTVPVACFDAQVNDKVSESVVSTDTECLVLEDSDDCDDCDDEVSESAVATDTGCLVLEDDDECGYCGADAQNCPAGELCVYDDDDDPVGAELCALGSVPSSISCNGTCESFQESNCADANDPLMDPGAGSNECSFCVSNWQIAWEWDRCDDGFSCSIDTCDFDVDDNGDGGTTCTADCVDDDPDPDPTECEDFASNYPPVPAGSCYRCQGTDGYWYSEDDCPAGQTCGGPPATDDRQPPHYTTPCVDDPAEDDDLPECDLSGEEGQQCDSGLCCPLDTECAIAPDGGPICDPIIVA